MVDWNGGKVKSSLMTSEAESKDRNIRKQAGKTVSSFREQVKKHLIPLLKEIRDGKRSGGYMMPLEKYHAPFIMANFDGTTENAYIMCHEGGHAFQTYLKRNEEIREKTWFTPETAGDYRIMHLENALSLIARECELDEFQQYVYENPKMSKSERNALWAKLESEYFPSNDYDGDELLEQGCGWQRIQHIFQWPFYAID